MSRIGKAAQPEKPSPAPSLGAGSEPPTAESLGWQLRAALPPMRLHSVSLYDHEGNVLWLSEGALGPDEHNLVLEALDTLSVEKTQLCHECGLEDGRVGIFLAVRAPQGDLVGLAMILADLKSLPDGIFDRLSTPQVRTILQKVAVLLRPNVRPEIVATPPPAAAAAASREAQAKTPPADEELSPHKIDEILELEIVPDSPAPEPPTAVSPAPAAPQEAPLELELTTEIVSPDQPAPAPSPATRTASASPPPATAPTSRPTLSAPSATPASPRIMTAAAAADVVLYVQQLTRIRAGGRTRRYEVLARSRAESSFECSSGLVVQRLLAWLGEHRAVWESEPTSFSIGLTAGALEDERFPSLVASCLTKSGVAPESIGFEIPEQVCVRHKTHVERFLEAAQRLGCFVVIDDFRLDSGAASVLRSKALRMVKLDPRLTSTAMRDKVSQALVVAISQAAKVLGIHCVAKQIESQSALQWLGAIGCDFALITTPDGPRPLESLLTAASESR